MKAYYNEIDPFAARWLRRLISAGLIADGEVDERSVTDVQAADLNGFSQHHFFAGIGGWSLALRLAGWPDDRPVWTGSCPCQPFSIANSRSGGFTDPRHLWPAWCGLIQKCHPSKIVGEQVADAIAKGWFDLVYGDLERAGYAVGAAVLPAYAVEAAHQRKRLYWVADAGSEGWEGYQPVERFPEPAKTPFPLYGDPLAGAWRALAGDYADLLPGDGVPISVERSRVRGYGNAIVPQVASEFLAAVMEAL